MKVGRYLLPSRRPAARWTIMKERNLLHVPIICEDSKPLGVINARGCGLAQAFTPRRRVAPAVRWHMMGLLIIRVTRP